MQAISKLIRILTQTRNPVPLLLDYAGLQRRPYRVASRDGVILELRPGAGDRFGFYEVILRNDYLAAGQSIRPGDTVIDVGANIGCFTLLAASRVGSTGRVIAVEPEARAFEQLRRNIELNGARNVIARRLAIGGRQGEVTLHTTAESALFSSIYTHVNRSDVAEGAQIVPMTTLAQLMRDESVARCHYLKLDCEGAEHDIVASLTRESAQRIGQVTLELHKVEGRDPGALGSRLQSLGFALADQRGLRYYRREPDVPSSGWGLPEKAQVPGKKLST
jgi:FkbM family methyltransferase